MIDFIKSISERCYNTAVKRGKDVSRAGCLQALAEELKELERAVAQHSAVDPSPLYDRADKMDDGEFLTAYNWRLHNTEADEIADVIITIATGYHAGLHDEVLAYVVESVSSGLTPDACEMVEQAVALKMRYNELRKD